MPVSHIFFDVHDVLVNPRDLGKCYAAGLGRVMVERYGGTVEGWATANRRIASDWDAYYADLDFNGDDGIRQAWEGQFRITRALFRLTNTPEPPHEELVALSREIPGIAPLGCKALYPEVPEALAQLRQMGFTLGVVSHAWEAHICAALDSVIHHFNGRIWGADTADRFEKDRERYWMAANGEGVDPSVCIALDDKPRPMDAARQAGMITIQCDRPGRFPRSPAHHVIRSLSELPPLCKKLLQE